MLNGSGDMAMVQGTAMIQSTRSGSSAGSPNCRAGGLVARLLLFQLCEFGLNHVLGGVVAGEVLGCLVALHLLHVHGGGAAGGGHVSVRISAQARGVLRS